MIGTVGQINRGSSLGEIIFNLCLEEDVENIVEIGTWNGMGSTKCIYDALSNKKNEYFFYSLESNKQFHDIAILNFKNLPNLPNFNLVFGSIIDPIENIDPLFNYEDSFFVEYSRSIQSEWFKEDIENCKNSPNVLNILPEKIDLLILDGGEFSSFAEFNKLKDRTKYFILDDTKLIKNNKVSKMMRESDDYEILYDSTERNGYLVSKKMK